MKFKSVFKSLFIAILMFFSASALAQVSGTFTIGGSSPDFTSIDSAFNYLENNGINGKVRFNIRSGTYNERTVIGAISGASSSNTIMVGPDSKNSSPVRIKTAITASTNNYILNIQQGYLQFDSLIFVVDSSSTYGGKVVDFTATCENIQFISCDFYGKDTTTTSTNFSILYDGSSSYIVDALNINKCNFYNGSYSVYRTGSSTVDEINTTITNNRFINFYYKSLHFLYQKEAKITGNYAIDINKYATAYGMYFSNCDSISITQNKIYCSGGSGYGLYVITCYGSATNPVLIANNFVSGYDGTRSGAYYGLYVTGGSYAYVYFNTSFSNNLSTSSRSVYLAQSTSTQYSRFVNNNCIHTGSGYAIYLSSLAGMASMDYNNYYSTGTNIGYYSSAITDLSSWKSATSMDANSLSVNSIFKSTTNLHTGSVALNGAATPISGITIDIDGETRNASTPDIGADEFDVASVDAAITFVKSMYCPGKQDVIVTLKNTGQDTIISAKINLSVSVNNGSFSSVGTYNYSGTLLSGKSVDLNVGTYNFSNANTYKLMAKVTNPNNVADGNPNNDSLISGSFKTSLSGAFTIGKAGADFPSIDSAFKTLSRQGLCGPVRLNLQSGTYNEQVVIGNISGISSSNKISLGPDPSNKTMPRVVYSATSTTDNYVFLLKSISHVNIDSITIVATGSTYGRAVVFEGINTNLSLLGDSIISSSLSANTSTNFAVVFDNTATANRNDYLTINGCAIMNGSYGIYIYGIGSTDFEVGSKITNNVIYGFTYYGLYSYYQSNILISDNIVVDNNTYTSPYGLRVYYNDSCVVTNNAVFVGGTSAPYGIYFYYCDGGTNNPSYLTNNVVNMYSNNATGTVYGIYSIEGTENRIAFNTVNVMGGSATARAIYLSYGTGDNAEIYNNNINNFGGGYSTYFGTITGITSSDYNNHYSSGNVLGYSGSAQNTLTDLQTATSFEANSVSANPNYKDQYNFLPTNSTLDSKGISLSYVTKDILGNVRNSKPDIGAFEFDPPQNDMSTVEIMVDHLPKCGNDSANAKVVIRNAGVNSQTGFSVTLVITSDTTISLSQTYSKKLSSQVMDTLTFSYFNTSKGGNFKFKAYTTIKADEESLNDTTTLTALFNSTPNIPSVNNFAVCELSTVSLTAKKPTKADLRWYDKMNGGKLLLEGDVFKVSGLKKDTAFYVSSVEGGLVANNITTINTVGNGCSGGVMFDIIPKVDMTLDSLYSISGTASGHYVYLYMRLGSYKGYEDTASAWSLVDSMYVIPTSITDYFNIPLKKALNLQKGATYGIYINDNARYTSSTSGSQTYSNDDVSILTGAGLCSKFGGINADRMFNGKLFYKVATYCESKRVKTSVKVNKLPAIDLGKDVEYCETPGLNLTLDGGKGMVSYSWSTTDTTQTISVTQDGSYSVIITDANGCSNSDYITITKNVNPIISLGSDIIYCSNSGIMMDLDAGSGYSSYSWSTGATTSKISIDTANIYFVNVTDNKNCIGADTIMIDEIQNPTLNLGKDTLFCTSEGILITLDAGAGLANYNWNTSDTTSSIQVNQAGTYGVVIMDSYGCSASDSMMVREQNNPVVNIGSDINYCQNDGIMQFVDAGIGFDKYNWSTGSDSSAIEVNTAGSYSVTVEDIFGCAAMDTMEVTETINPVIDLGKDTSYCASNGINTVLRVTPGYAEYLWSNAEISDSINVNVEGTYSVIVTDAMGCSGEDTLVIKMNPNPVVDLGNDRILNPDLGINETLDASAGFKSYKWNTGETTQTINVTQAGKYFVTVFDDNGCDGSDSIEVRTWIIGATPTLSLANLSVYPNPADNAFTIKVVGENRINSIEVYSMDGRNIYSVSESMEEKQLVTENWANGMYLLKVNTEKGSTSLKLNITHR